MLGSKPKAPPPGTTEERPGERRTPTIEDDFVQPAEESQITRDVTQLRLIIASHVDDHYSGLIHVPLIDVVTEIVTVDDEDQSFARLLLNGDAIRQESVRLAAIQRCITNSIIKHITFDGDPDATFLPDDVVSILALVPRPNEPCTFLLQVHKNRETKLKATVSFAASAKLRQLTANLLSLGQRGESKKCTEQRQISIDDDLQRLHEILTPLAGPASDDAARKDQLAAIMEMAARTGIMLLYQPATFMFDRRIPLERSSTSNVGDHSTRRSKRGLKFGIFPALLRTGDSTGRLLRRPDIMCRAHYWEDE